MDNVSFTRRKAIYILGPILVATIATPWQLGSMSAAGAKTASPPEHVVSSQDATASPSLAGVPDNPARGVVWDGLAPGRPDGPCVNQFELQTATRTACTHGPDAGPSAWDMRVRRSTAALTSTPTSAMATTGSVPCYGDGTSGDRVQVIYAH